MSKLACDYTEQSIEALAYGLNDPKHYLAAAVVLLDKGWGKATVRDIEGGIDGPPRAETLESEEEWLARRRKELAALVAEAMATNPQ